MLPTFFIWPERLQDRGLHQQIMDAFQSLRDDV